MRGQLTSLAQLPCGCDCGLHVELCNSYSNFTHHQAMMYPSCGCADVLIAVLDMFMSSSSSCSFSSAGVECRAAFTSQWALCTRACVHKRSDTRCYARAFSCSRCASSDHAAMLQSRHSKPWIIREAAHLQLLATQTAHHWCRVKSRAAQHVYEGKQYLGSQNHVPLDHCARIAQAQQQKTRALCAPVLLSSR